MLSERGKQREDIQALEKRLVALNRVDAINRLAKATVDLERGTEKFRSKLTEIQYPNVEAVIKEMLEDTAPPLRDRWMMDMTDKIARLKTEGKTRELKWATNYTVA